MTTAVLAQAMAMVALWDVLAVGVYPLRDNF